MRKGQIQQVFIYIMTIIVVGLILLVGYKSIGGLMKKGCDVEMSTFKSTIESYVSKYTSYGDLHTEYIKVPCSFSEICFIDTKAVTDGKDLSSSMDSTKYGIIIDSVNNEIQENIFLVKKEVTEPAGYMKEIMVDNGTFKYICMENVNGKFYIKFQGLGRQVNISAGG